MQTSSEREFEKYACDPCRASKVACSREARGPGCQRCRKTGISCMYSRQGIIRRSRRRTQGATHALQTDTAFSQTSPAKATDPGEVQSHLAPDVDATRKCLSNLQNPENHESSQALSTLVAITSTPNMKPWCHGGTDDLYMFRVYAAEWAETFESYISRNQYLNNEAPPDLLEKLKKARIGEIKPRAWLVIYYSVILRNATLEDITKNKLRTQLQLALNDVGILLAPSELNIHAILLAMGPISEFAGPSLCWMFANSACRMLQAIGVKPRYLNRSESDMRRVILFSHLNLLDKGLAMIFGRNPTFNRDMVQSIGIPSLQECQLRRSHLTADEAPRNFETHYAHQKIVLSHLMDDIWSALYCGDIVDEEIDKASEGLNSWYEQTVEILESASTIDKYFHCGETADKSIKIALTTIKFHYLYLSILLGRDSPSRTQQCFDASKEMLNLLQYMGPESESPYHPFIWQLAFCPFTPLLVLFNAILNDTCSLNEKEKALNAMGFVPTFLNALRSRTLHASKLEDISNTIRRRAASLVRRSEGQNSDAIPSEAVSEDSMLYCESNMEHLLGMDDCAPTFENSGTIDWLSWDMDLDWDVSLPDSLNNPY